LPQLFSDIDVWSACAEHQLRRSSDWPVVESPLGFNISEEGKGGRLSGLEVIETKETIFGKKRRTAFRYDLDRYAEIGDQKFFGVPAALVTASAVK
jgi:hypothetical protein